MVYHFQHIFEELFIKLAHYCNPIYIDEILNSRMEARLKFLKKYSIFLIIVKDYFNQVKI